MKCTKALCATAVAATMIATMGSSVWASEMGPNENHETKVTYKVTENYTWSVPATVDLGTNKGFEGNETIAQTQDDGVKILSNVINVGKKLEIKIGKNQEFKIETKDKRAEREYEVYNNGTGTGTALKAGDVVLSAEAGINTAKTAMAYKLKKVQGDNKSELVGDYEGTLSYEAALADVTTEE